MDEETLTRGIEAVLFAAGEPVEIKRLSDTFETDPDEIVRVTDALADQLSFDRRGVRIVRLGEAYQMCSSGEMADFVTKALETRKPPKLSASQLEALTVIAYYQPATKAVVEQIRGVDSSYTVGLLLERGLIEECGRLQVPGRPRLYRTTKKFLRDFHLGSLEELPEMPGLEADGQLRMTDDGTILDPGSLAAKEESPLTNEGR